MAELQALRHSDLQQVRFLRTAVSMYCTVAHADGFKPGMWDMMKPDKKKIIVLPSLLTSVLFRLHHFKLHCLNLVSR